MMAIPKFLIIIFCMFGLNMFYSQTSIPLYKMSMNSDAVLIVESRDYQQITKQESEYYTSTLVKLKNIKNVLKNKHNQNFKNSVNFIETDNNDFFLNVNGENCSGIGYTLEKDKKYYNILFLKKKNKNYFIIGRLWNNIVENDLSFFEKNINIINEISKIKDVKSKVSTIKEWFQNANENHPENFIIDTPFTEEFNVFFKIK
ncbi:MAG: hypothetical protein ACN6OB_02425 [Chryseobacterium jejuense]|uniref:hypothetical protein n=1 Tax=Chryseobacterium jejuense TaxID=445960 RepID=UPI003D0EE53E